MLRNFKLMLLLIVLSFGLNSSINSTNNEVDLLWLYEEVLNQVKSNYVEKTTDKQLIESSLNGMLSQLDPHSSYLDEKAYKEMNMSTKGEFGGLGLEVTTGNGMVKVISPIDDTPAAKAGIQPGDYIIGIDDQMIIGISLSEAVDRMRGEPGSKIKLSIYREGKNEPLEYDIIRDIIKMTSVKSIDYDDIGYIRITAFSEDTTASIKKEINDLKNRKDKKLNGIILDLRNNPGGLLSQAINVSDLFLDSGPIVSTKGRNFDNNYVFEATKSSDDILDLPIVLLINSGSASASEIVAGALQDYKRAVIIGTKSFGKGSVQNVLPLPNGGAIKMTTSRYYTPNGRSIQAEGINPDINVEPAKIEFFDRGTKKIFNESSYENHLANDKKQDIKEVADQLASDLKEQAKESEKELYAKDYQLARALDLLRGIVIYENVINAKN